MFGFQPVVPLAQLESGNGAAFWVFWGREERCGALFLWVEWREASVGGMCSLVGLESCFTHGLALRVEFLSGWSKLGLRETSILLVAHMTSGAVCIGKFSLGLFTYFWHWLVTLFGGELRRLLITDFSLSIFCSRFCRSDSDRSNGSWNIDRIMLLWFQYLELILNKKTLSIPWFFLKSKDLLQKT